MRRLLVLSVAILGLVIAGCTGGAAGDPKDDIGDIIVLTHSPGNGDQLDEEDSLDADPTDPQGTRNVRLFFFDTTQGAFDPGRGEPTGGNVLVEATTVLTTTNRLNDTLIIRPTGVSVSTPLDPGQYSVTVEVGTRGADGAGMAGDEYFFFFRVGQDALGPVVVSSSPHPNEKNVDPTTDLVITMSETIQAATVNASTIRVSFQPAGTAQPTPVPGNFYTDGGNGPGNNFPNLQLDHNGNPGLSGTSPRNGTDIVFRPDLTAFPVNMTAYDPTDFRAASAGPPATTACDFRTDPPRKGNQGFPLGQAITVEFVTLGVGVTDTAGNPVDTSAASTVFTFQTRELPDPVFAPNTRGAVYYGDTIGVGVIDVDSSRTPYIVGPNPARPPNSVVATGTGPAQKIIRVAVPDLVDLTTDTRPYTSFYGFLDCRPQPPGPAIAMGNVYAASASVGGGEVVVIDAFRLVPLGRFGTPSPGGIALTAIGAGPNTGRLTVSNFSANTVTVFDIGDVMWFTGGSLWIGQGGLQTAVQ
ncbi:MAG: Ig-like domain-containing domain, partial [Planctomycetota bacterium]